MNNQPLQTPRQTLTSLVIQSSRYVQQNSKYVKINEGNIQKLLPELSFEPLNTFFDPEILTKAKSDNKQNKQIVLQYIFVLDSLIFCFWPLENYEANNLSSGVLKYLNETTKWSLQKLESCTKQQISQKLFDNQNICLLQSRTQILNNLASTIINKHKSSFVQLIKSANKSAVKLLQTIVSELVYFQDHAIYQGHQIHFYKRAQLLIRHIYGIFEGQGLGQFYDISQITIFPDYRLPQVFNTFGIFEYSKQLDEKIQNKIQIQCGSDQEIQIRAATVIAAEIIKKIINQKKQNENKITSIELDWALWYFGQTNLDKLKPHHRTLTIYY